MVPADHRGIDEALHQVGLLVDQFAAGLDQGRIGVEAIIRQQDDARLEAGAFFDCERLGGDIALHRALLVGEKRLRIEGVGLDLVLAESVFGLQPLKIARDPLLGHEQRQRLEILQPGDLGFRMGQENLRVLLEDGGDGYHRHLVGDRIERLQGVGGHEEVELAGDQQHAIVVVRAARHDGDVEPVGLIGTVGRSLEKPAMLRFGDPVGSERDLVQCSARSAGTVAMNARRRPAVNARGKRAGFMIGLRRLFWPMIGSTLSGPIGWQVLRHGPQTSLQIHPKKRLAR